MTNETLTNNSAKQQQPNFGARLMSAREALGLERKDAAAQLRLNEKIILMMEKEKFSADLPATFIRGYIRAYGKLLQIPECEIKIAVENIKSTPAFNYPRSMQKTIIIKDVTSGNYFMQFFTYLILFTLLGLAGMWWYSHTPISAQLENLSSIFKNKNLLPLTKNINELSNTDHDPLLTQSPKKNEEEALGPNEKNKTKKLTRAANSNIIPILSSPPPVAKLNINEEAEEPEIDT